MQTSEFIDELAAGNASNAKDMLNDMISARAFEALEGRKVELAKGIFNGSQVQEEGVEELTEQDVGNGYKMRMKHSDKGRIHAPSGEHVADVTKHESGGWAYHSGNSKWDGSENSPHYKTGVEKTKSAAAKKAAEIHASN
jgi:hypothetical protein